MSERRLKGHKVHVKQWFIFENTQCYIRVVANIYPHFVSGHITNAIEIIQFIG